MQRAITLARRIDFKKLTELASACQRLDNDLAFQKFRKDHYSVDTRPGGDKDKKNSSVLQLCNSFIKKQGDEINNVFQSAAMSVKIR